MDRPLIAITGPQTGAWGPRLFVALGVRLAGGRPIQVRPRDHFSTHDWQGVVVSGGHDINPVLYAAEPEILPRHDQERDLFESRIIDQALQAGLPLLGICRGAQLLNVRLGGSLYQNLKSRREKTSNRRTLLPLKQLIVVQDSLLERVLDTHRCRVNSLHNQAINRLGGDLRIAGKDLDGIVQAIEDAARPCLVGVQWHPEFLLFMGRQRRLFRHLVTAASDFNPQSPPAS